MQSGGQVRSSWQRSSLRSAGVVLPVLAVLLLAGYTASTKATASPTPSATPEPVQVTVALKETGKVGDADFALSATVTITNHQAQDIKVTSVRPDPPYAPVMLRLYVPPTATVFQFIYPYVIAHEPFQTDSDIATIAARGSRSWTVPLYLTDVPAQDVQPRITCLVQAIEFWHTGPLVVDGKEIPPVETDGEGQITLK